MGLPLGFITAMGDRCIVSSKIRELRAGTDRLERLLEKAELRYRQEGLKLESLRKDIERRKTEIDSLGADYSFPFRGLN